MPEYAHLPLIVDAESRAKLSKRHGAVALEDFRDDGYLPEALMNYLALLGWAPADDGDEVIDADELVAAFDLDRVTHAAAGFDRAKLDWLNGEWIRRLAARRARSRESNRSPARASATASTRRSSLRRSAIAQERAVTLVQIVDQMGFLFVDEADFRIAPESWEVVERTDRIGEVLDAVIAHVEDVRLDRRRGRLPRALTDDRALGDEDPQGDARALRGGRGPAPRASRCSTRCTSSGGSAPSPGSAPPGPRPETAWT